MPLLLRPHHRSAPASAVDLLLVGGVPGAGKSTAIAAAAPDLAGVRVLDPDALRRWFAEHLPAGTPYRRYRPLCHILHAIAVLLLVTVGPRPAYRAGPAGLAGRRLLVHDPSTRAGRLRVLSWLAHRRGWTLLLLYVEATPTQARAGQRARGRVLDTASFAAHVHRWNDLRLRATTGRCAGWPCRLTSREDAAQQVRRAFTVGSGACSGTAVAIAARP